jgi:hypothetical protein
MAKHKGLDAAIRTALVDHGLASEDGAKSLGESTGAEPEILDSPEKAASLGPPDDIVQHSANLI